MPSKKLIVIVAAVLVLVAGGGAGAFYFFKQKAAAAAALESEEEGSEEKAPPKEVVSQEPPMYVPMENMVANVQDPNGTRMVQIGIILVVDNAKTQEQVKVFTPAIRSHVLMQVTQYSAETLLTAEGKNKLKSDIAATVRKSMGLPELDTGDKAKDSEKESTKKKSKSSPVKDVLFSSFIVQ